MSDDKPVPGEQAAGELSVETLADLHAGVLDEQTVAQLWPRVRDNPQAQAVLAALEATSADLGSVGAGPAEPIPDDVGNRIDAALAEESRSAQGRQAPVVSIDTARRRRNRLLTGGAGLVTTVAAAVAAILVLTPVEQVEQLPYMARPAPSAGAQAGAEPGRTQGPPPALRHGNLGAAVGSVVGVREFGRLHGEARLDACLAANGIDPDVEPAGIRPATIDGQPAVIVLYPTGEFAQYRLIALPPDCDTNNPGLLADTIIGRGATGG